MRFYCSCGEELEIKPRAIFGERSILHHSGVLFKKHYVIGRCKNPVHFNSGWVADLFGFSVEIPITKKMAKEIRAEEKLRELTERMSHRGRVEP